MLNILLLKTKLLILKGLVTDGSKQMVEDLVVYPEEFFNPLDSLTGKLKKTKNTYSIHWYAASWEDVSQTRLKINRFIRRIVGVKNIEKIKSLLGR